MGSKMSKTGALGAFATVLASLVLVSAAPARAPDCPKPSNGHLLFKDGSLMMKTGLAVNPDGALASYMPGDTGFTYIANGVNINDNGVKVSCVANQSRCRREWLRAESENFAKGTQEFCSFAIDVEPIDGGQKIACEFPKKKGRYLIGNGKGRPKLGSPVKNISGKMVQPYVSMTTLTHTVGGETKFVDSSAIPALVVPEDRGDLVGSIAWVRFGDRETFAVINDTGPAFGEGSVALHDVLQRGSVDDSHPIGPIPLEMRCGEAEKSLRVPFLSAPDSGSDRCRPGYTAKQKSDVRAKTGIGSGVTSIILPVRATMKGTHSTDELSLKDFERRAADAGFTSEKLNAMATCSN
jgi:hypothetical protein